MTHVIVRVEKSIRVAHGLQHGSGMNRGARELIRTAEGKREMQEGAKIVVAPRGGEDHGRREAF